jgi:CRISPR-associated endonuclease Csn1
MKKILGLDLGTNSIGWALVEQDFKNKSGKINDLGVRIVPMSADVLGKFDAGQSISQTADRTSYRGTRRLYQRDNLRRERLHRVLNVLDFLPKHYAESIDFEKKLGQFNEGEEVKINYEKNAEGRYEFLFKDSFNEMVEEFRKHQPDLFYKKENGKETKIPYDWTLYYLRKKALTQALTKEELAWVILNFNQKRGYYQRGGEEENKDKKEYVEVLKINGITKGDRDKKNDKKFWYTISFENGWEYSATFQNGPKWINTEREFLITEEYDKDGNIRIVKDRKTDKVGKEKRKITPLPTFEEINLMTKADQDRIFKKIKVKTELTIKNSGKTVGEYIYENLLKDPSQKIRGKLVRTIERKFYKDEFEKIIAKQIELQPNLFSKELYVKCVEELYPRNEAHQNNLLDKGFEYFLTEDIIFYQRPLKSQKSNISGCPFEFRSFKQTNKETGKEELIKVSIQAISKSHPLFQEFRIWQWLQNLKIYSKEQTKNGQLLDVTHQLLPTDDEWVSLFDFLNAKKELEQKHLIAYFTKLKRIDKKDKEQFRWNYPEDKKYPFAETRAQFISRLSKIESIENPEQFLDEKTKVGNKENSPHVSRLEQLWHLIYSVTDLNEYKSALEKFAQKHEIDKESFVESFIKFPPFKSDYGSYSQKAIKKLLPLMRMGAYWNENDISSKEKERAANIMERVNALALKEEHTSKELAEAIALVSDDDIPKQLVKSFIPFKDKNPLKGLNTYQATYLVYGRFAEVGEIQKWNNSFEIQRYLYNFKQHSLRNPIVEQVVTETLRVVKDIWEYYGEKEGVEYDMVYDEIKKRNVKSYLPFFNEIHVELGREMKSPADKRKRISEKNAENENTNYRIKEVLKELMNDTAVEGDVRDYSPSHQEILKIYEEGIYQNPEVDYSKISEDEIQKIRKTNKPSLKDIQRYKLWLEQGYISPYTGKLIPLSKLFTTEYQIEHIIPQSRYFDNSLSNKIICESDVNEDKSNKTAYEYLKDKNGSIIHGHKLMTIDQYESHVNKYFKNNRQKLRNLLSEEIPEGFINRQLNDSRYISKLIKGLLSNVVRAEGEQETTSKNLIPVTGAVTSKLKQDWGLNDKWNEIVAPRFKRLNKLTDSEDFGFWDKNINAFRIQVPDEISKGFSKKRIDHRHHALDALVVACTSRDHTHYLSALNSEKENFTLRDKLLIKNKHNDYTKAFQLPWEGFTIEAKDQLEKTVISFKQNLRVINKATNKFWSYKDEKGKVNLGKDGKPKKKLRKQTKGDNWAIRQPLHEETISGKIDLPWVKYEKGKFITATRKVIDKTFTLKKIKNITDTGIQKILTNYLTQDKFKITDKNGKIDYNTEKAFSPEGIEDMNLNIQSYNDSKKHQPIYKVRLFEQGSGRFSLGENGKNGKKFVQGSPNLFFAIYKSEENMYFETIPLKEIIIHQKNEASFPKRERTKFPVKNIFTDNKGKEHEVKLHTVLSPLDLIYIPTDEERENPEQIDFNNLSLKQIERLYNVNDFSGLTCYFTPNRFAKAILQKEVDLKYNDKKKKLAGSFDSKTASLDGSSIKESCIKLKVDRLGNVSKA